MGLILEKQEKLLALMPGVYHNELKENFKPYCLGILDDSLALYCDYAPDASNTGDYIYKIQKEISFKELSHVYIEKLDDIKKLDYNMRFNLIMSNDDNDILFYFKKEEKTRLKEFVNVLKKVKIKVKKRTI